MSQLTFPGPRRSTGHWTKASCRWKSISDLVNTPVKQTIVIWKPVTLILQSLIDWNNDSNEWITEWMALQMYWMGQDGDANKHGQASRRLPLTKIIQLIRLALCWNVHTDHWWKINVSGKKNCIPRSQHSVRFTNIRELCVSRPWALRNCQNPWDSREIRESWRLWPELDEETPK